MVLKNICCRLWSSVVSGSGLGFRSRRSRVCFPFTMTEANAGPETPQNNTIYINNLNEKIKIEGPFFIPCFLFLRINACSSCFDNSVFWMQSWRNLCTLFSVSSGRYLRCSLPRRSSTRVKLGWSLKISLLLPMHLGKCKASPSMTSPWYLPYTLVFYYLFICCVWCSFN